MSRPSSPNHRPSRKPQNRGGNHKIYDTHENRTILAEKIPHRQVKVEKVLVASWAEKSGLVEHGLSTLEHRRNQWVYIATAENPEKDDWSVAVTAVRALRYETKFRLRAWRR